MHLSLDGFIAGPNGEMNWIRVDEEIFDHAGKRISRVDTALHSSLTNTINLSQKIIINQFKASSDTEVNIDNSLHSSIH